MLSDSVFDLDACVLFRRIKDLKDEDEIKKVIASFLQEANIPSRRMECKFHPTFMAHCVACRHNITPVAASLLLPSSEWNGKPFQPESGQCQIH